MTTFERENEVGFKLAAAGNHSKAVGAFLEAYKLATKENVSTDHLSKIKYNLASSLFKSGRPLSAQIYCQDLSNFKAKFLLCSIWAAWDPTYASQFMEQLWILFDGLNSTEMTKYQQKMKALQLQVKCDKAIANDPSTETLRQVQSDVTTFITAKESTPGLLRSLALAELMLAEVSDLREATQLRESACTHARESYACEAHWRSAWIAAQSLRERSRKPWHWLAKALACDHPVTLKRDVRTQIQAEQENFDKIDQLLCRKRYAEGCVIAQQMDLLHFPDVHFGVDFHMLSQVPTRQDSDEELEVFALRNWLNGHFMVCADAYTKLAEQMHSTWQRATAKFLAAVAFYKAESYEKALSILQNVLSLHDTLISFFSYKLLAVIHYIKKDYQLTLESLLHCRHLYPSLDTFSKDDSQGLPLSTLITITFSGASLVPRSSNMLPDTNARTLKLIRAYTDIYISTAYNIPYEKEREKESWGTFLSGWAWKVVAYTVGQPLSQQVTPTAFHSPTKLEHVARLASDVSGQQKEYDTQRMYYNVAIENRLKEFNIDFSKLTENILNPLAKYDKDGWRELFVDSSFSKRGKLLGATIRPNGEYDIYFERSENGPILSDEDICVAVNLTNQGIEPSFSLDYENSSADCLLFQKKYYPFSELYATSIGDVMFFADYLLKQITTGFDINVISPFGLRNFKLPPSLAGLPDHFSFPSSSSSMRVWFVCEQMTILEAHNFSATFGDVKIGIKCKQTKRNATTGELEDVPLYDVDLATKNAIEQYTSLFTSLFSEACRYYPEFLVLEQLYKLLALLQWMKNNNPQSYSLFATRFPFDSKNTSEKSRHVDLLVPAVKFQSDTRSVVGGVNMSVKNSVKYLPRSKDNWWGSAQVYGNNPQDHYQYEKMKRDLREHMQKPIVHHPKLQNIMNDLYRPTATVGSGSTAAAYRYTKATGIKVGGSEHIKKTEKDYINALQNWWNNNPRANLMDRLAAENVLRDMLDAINTPVGWFPNNWKEQEKEKEKKK